MIIGAGTYINNANSHSDNKACALSAVIFIQRNQNDRVEDNDSHIHDGEKPQGTASDKHCTLCFQTENRRIDMRETTELELK